ncbi:MAG: hypothetical protein ACKO6Q_08395 [Bacteroidota bacterium]
MRILLTTIFCLGLWALHAQPNLQKAGKQSFVYGDVEAVKEKPIRVWFYSPTDRPDTLPIVIMLHGAERNASAYMDSWIPVANLYQYVIVAPEFSKEDYAGGARYNQGNVYSEKMDKFLPKEQWTFSVIEPLFDYVRQETQNIYPWFYLSGHSAGAQFVHRFLYFVPNNRAHRVMMANAGWYTLPELKTDFPFGLDRSVVSETDLKTVFSKEVFLVLGESDTDTTSANFQKGPEYNKQGLNRYERGQNYFRACTRAAADLKTPFRWKLISMPGVAHSNAETAKAAGALFKMNLR